MDLYQAVRRAVERGGLVVALGGLDSGKSTFCRLCAEAGVRLGRRVAYLDADVGQTTVGPPTTIGLKFIDAAEDLEPEALARADALYFVGSTSPSGHMVPMVVGVARLAQQARAAGAEVIVVDTTGWIGGTQGQVLKLAKVEVLQPDLVIGFQRGGELEPILGSIRRIHPSEIESVSVDPSIMPTTVEERAERRRLRLAEAFPEPRKHWKVKPSILVPAVPPDIDPDLLDGLLVGMEDGKGSCVGLGILECREGSLRLLSPDVESAKALRLGSVRVRVPEFTTTNVDLRELFLTD